MKSVHPVLIAFLALANIILLLAPKLDGQDPAQIPKATPDQRRYSSHIFDGQPKRRALKRSLPRREISRAAPMLAPRPAQTYALPFFDDFEKGVGGWSFDGFFNLIINAERFSVLNPDINPTLVTLPDQGQLPRAFSGIGMWWFGETATGTFIGSDFKTIQQDPLNGGQSTQSQSGSLISPPIDLRQATRAQLNFKTWWEIEGVDVDQFDSMRVEISTDGGMNFSSLGQGTLNPLNDVDGKEFQSYSSGGLGQPGIWINQLFDLTPFVGDTARLRFRFDTVDEDYNGFRGWFIDDVSVTGNALPAPVITKINPAISFAGELAHIEGENFVNGATVTIGASVATAIISTNLAVIEVPDLEPGRYDVTLTNPDEQTASVAAGLTITNLPPPIVNSIEPDTALFGATVFATIRGGNFQAGTTAEIAGLAISNLTVVDDSTITGNTPANLAPGNHNVKVINADSQFDQLISAFSIIQMIRLDEPQLNNIPMPEQNLNLTVVTPSNFQPTIGQLFYRPAGRSNYQAATLTQAGNNLTGIIPADSVTIRGIEYYVSLSDGQIVVTFPANDPVNSPAVIQVRVDRLAYPLPLEAKKHRMISVPLVLQKTGIDSVFADDYGPYDFLPQRWRLFHWQPEAYAEYLDITAKVMPGTAFWLISLAGEAFDVDSALSVGSDQAFAITLQPGFNQIGNPFAFEVAWGDVGGSAQVQAPVRWNGDEYEYNQLTLAPFEGYFVFNPLATNVTLSVPPVEFQAGDGDGDEALSKSPRSGKEFVLQIKAQGLQSGWKDQQNFAGMLEGATNELDRLDFLEAPPFGDGLRLRSIDADKSYAGNFHKISPTGSFWDVQISTTGKEERVRLVFADAEKLPANFQIWLLDKDRQSALPLHDGEAEVEAPEKGAVKSLRLIVGTPELAQQSNDGIPLVPYQFALRQNYPNPFNRSTESSRRSPETRIEYELAARSEVRLEIFNLLGQRVRTLIDQTQNAGTHAARWDGKDSRGHPVSSGVYLYRLKAVEFVEVRKLVLSR